MITSFSFYIIHDLKVHQILNQIPRGKMLLQHLPKYSNKINITPHTDYFQVQKQKHI
jgi:hypothetical protein